MARSKWLLVSLLGLGCSTPSTGSPQPEPASFEGNTVGCGQVEQTCLSTDPPQCFDYCADAPPKKGGACKGDGDVKTCGDSTCVVGEDESGKPVQVCVGMDCTVSYEASTGKETIFCAGSDAGVSDAPGTADGSAGSD
jgi:hypothetical protein